MRKEELKNCRQFKELFNKSEQARKDGKTTAYTYLNNVPLTWCVEYDLTTLELLTYCYIRDCTKNMKEGAFTGSIKGLNAKFNTAKPTQLRALEKLQAKGFIFKRKSPRGEVQWVRYVDGLARYWAREDQRDIKTILEANAYVNQEQKKREEKEKERINNHVSRQG